MKNKIVTTELTKIILLPIQQWKQNDYDIFSLAVKKKIVSKLIQVYKWLSVKLVIKSNLIYQLKSQSNLHMSMRKNGQIAQRSTILCIIFGNFTKVIFRIGSMRNK